MEGQKFSKDKLPMYIVLYKQFPHAIQEIVKCSQAGHEKYKDTDLDWLNFKRVPDAYNQYMNASLRHMSEEGINEDMKEWGNVLHEAQVIWNLCAALEVKLEENNNDK